MMFHTSKSRYYNSPDVLPQIALRNSFTRKVATGELGLPHKTILSWKSRAKALGLPQK
jgi:hypothetical protein